MNSTVVRLYKPPKPTLTDPNAQINWMFFQLEAESKERRAAGVRYAKKVYMQFVMETKAYYPELEENPRFHLANHWEVDALIRFNKWLVTQNLASRTRYSIYKTVRQVMDMAYALRVTDTVVYHAPLFKGVSETQERAAYAKREQEIINAAVAKWLSLTVSVLQGYTPTGEGIPYRKRDFDTTISVEGRDYKVDEAAKLFGIEHNKVTERIRQGWTPHQAVGLAPSPNAPSLNWVLNGVTYQTVTQVANDFGLTVGLIGYRIRNGWQPEEIVGIAPEPKKKFSKITGKAREIIIEGATFASLRLAAQHYGIEYHVLKNRFNLGWTIQEALELVERERLGTKITVEDVEYNSISEAARTYKVNASAVGQRLRLGYTPEQAVGLMPIQVLQKDERALLWMFENEFGCDAHAMLTHFYENPRPAICTEQRLRKLFSKWGVWPYVDDRLVMPLAVEMGMLTGLNVESLKELDIASYQTQHRLTGQPVITYLKRRSGNAFRSEDRELHLPILELEELYLDDSVMAKVDKLVTMILAITSRIRDMAPAEISRKLFIFEDVERSRREGSQVIVALDPKRKAGKWYRRFCNEEGLYEIFGPGFNFNISRCRPTLVTNMVLAGADLFQVQMALGHESIQTTATYLDEKQIRPVFNKTMSETLDKISHRSQEAQQDSNSPNCNSGGCGKRDISGFNETLSGCGCADPYQPSENVKKLTNFKEGFVCKYWNMCLLCDQAIITEKSLPKLILYGKRVSVALEVDSASIAARKHLYEDIVKLIEGILKADVIFPQEVIEKAKYLAATMDDLLVDHLIYQGI